MRFRRAVGVGARIGRRGKPSAAPVPADEDTFPEEEVARTKLRGWILRYARPGAVGAEFGVFRGHFAAEIAERVRPRKLYLVDPWRKLGERFDWPDRPEFDARYTNFNRLTTRQAFADARYRMQSFAGQTEVEFVEDFAVVFCERLSSRLDFAYIDAQHDYDSALTDLKAVSQVIADDGVIMGDDWIDDPEHPHAGVLRAVNDFIRAHPWELVAAGLEGQWCIRRTPDY